MGPKRDDVWSRLSKCSLSLVSMSAISFLLSIHCSIKVSRLCCSSARLGMNNLAFASASSKTFTLFFKRAPGFGSRARMDQCTSSWHTETQSTLITSPMLHWPWLFTESDVTFSEAETNTINQDVHAHSIDTCHSCSINATISVLVSQRSFTAQVKKLNGVVPVPHRFTVIFFHFANFTLKLFTLKVRIVEKPAIHRTIESPLMDKTHKALFCCDPPAKIHPLPQGDFHWPLCEEACP